MRYVFLGHSHHGRTGSSRFMLDALRTRGTVEERWLDTWRTDEPFDATSLARDGFDGVVVWQLEEVARAVAAAGLPNVTFFPMYDSCHAFPDSYWRRLRDLKIVCFSSTLHARLQRLGLRTRLVRYFPDPAGLGAVAPSPGPSGFFWQRQQDVTWATIRALLGDAAFARFTLHDAMDPGHGEAELPGEEERRARQVRITRWFASPEEARDELRRHGVFFAPRLREGIGMSFLEAMAMGMLVVAPDRPTMSEYIVSGVNGLLYDPARPGALDFARWRELGARARETVASGHKRWRRALPALLDLVAAPTSTVAAAAPLTVLEDGRPGGEPSRGRHAGGRSRSPPRITAVVLGDRGAGELEETLASLAAGAWRPEQVLVVEPSARPEGDRVRRRWRGAVGDWRSAPGGTVAMAGAAAAWVTSDHALFLPAGDRLAGAGTLAEVVQEAAPGAAVVCGGHVRRDPAGVEELVLPWSLHEAWLRLRRGDLAWEWLTRLPIPAATIWRTAELQRWPLRTDLPELAHEERLLRLARDGSPLHHALTVVGTTRCRRETLARRRRWIAAWEAVAREMCADPGRAAGSIAALSADARGLEPWRLSGLELLLGVARIPGSVRELKRRLRAQHARRAALP